MKLNLDCMRDTLIAIEENTGFDDNGESLEFTFAKLCEALKQYTIGELKFTVLRLKENDLVKVSMCNADNDPFYYCSFYGLTGIGEKTLSEISSNKKWEKIKKQAKDYGVPTIEFVLKAAGLLSGFFE